MTNPVVAAGGLLLHTERTRPVLRSAVRELPPSTGGLLRQRSGAPGESAHPPGASHRGSPQEALPTQAQQGLTQAGYCQCVIALLFWLLLALLSLIVAYWVIRLAVRDGVIDANAKTQEATAQHASP
jgi:hypothetical protein